MLRARLASVALAGSLLLAAGCSSTSSFNLFHPTRSSRNAGCPVECDCGDMVGFSSAPCCPAPSCPTGGCGVPLISNAHPPLVEGPALFPPSPTPLMFPGATMPPVGATRIAPLPPVTSIPQAIATPSPP